MAPPPGYAPYPYPPGAAPYPYPPGAGPYPYPPPGYYPYPPPGYYPYSPTMPPPDNASSSESPTRWYGWQVLIPGLLFNTVTAVGAYTFLWPVLLPGLVGSVFSPPIVHWAHGHGAKGAASFGIQLGAAGLATGLWFLGVITAFSGSSDGAGYYVLSTVGVGVMITGTALDAAFLAREPTRRTLEARSSFSMSLAPLVLPSQQLNPGLKSPTTGGLSVVGTF